MRARNWNEFVGGLKRWGAPGENQVYADRSGHIGWQPCGFSPIRRNWDGLLPVPGDGRYEWDGFLDPDLLPAERDPKRGWIATANAENLPRGYPYRKRKIGFEWAAPFRLHRIQSVLRRQRAFGYTAEDLSLLLEPMAQTGEEPTGSMGSDTPLAVLSQRPRLLYDYFKQMFAQVTNPPLDAIREQLVTAMASTIGPERNLLRPEPEACRQIGITYLVIDNDQLVFLETDRGAEEQAYGATSARAVPTAGSDPGQLSDAHRLQYLNFLAALDGTEQLRVDLSTNRQSIAVITGVYESARTGRPVTLS